MFFIWELFSIVVIQIVFFPRQTISSVRFYYPLQIQIEKKCLKHYGEKGNMQQRNEKKTRRVENLIEKKFGPTNKYRDITFVTLPAEKMEDVILISGYQI